MQERKGVVTFQGKPVTLLGPEVQVGQRAPDFQLLDINLNESDLSQTRGKVRLLSVVFSLDTPVCDPQIQRFDQEAGKIAKVVIYVISMDLPFAQARYFQAHNIKNLKMLSDYRDATFGLAYGVLIKEMRLLARAIFVIDSEDIVRYSEYVKEITQSPDYEKVLAVLKEIAFECSDVHG